MQSKNDSLTLSTFPYLIFIFFNPKYYSSNVSQSPVSIEKEIVK